MIKGIRRNIEYLIIWYITKPWSKNNQYVRYFITSSMRDKMKFVLVVLAYLTAFMPSSSQAQEFEISVLGTVHKYHLNPRWGYSLYDLAAQIENLKPDLICGEIPESEYQSDLEGVSPPETVIVEWAAHRSGAIFVPADWRGYYHDFKVANDSLSPEESGLIKKAEQGLFDSLPKEPQQVFDYLHSESAQQKLKAFNELVIKLGTEVAQGYWYARNQMIVKKCINAARKNHSKRLLFVFGASHNYIIKEYLFKNFNMKVSPVKKFFQRTSNVFPKDIYSRWIKRKTTLELLLTKEKIDLAQRELILDSNRISDLTEFIKSQPQTDINKNERIQKK